MGVDGTLAVKFGVSDTIVKQSGKISGSELLLL